MDDDQILHEYFICEDEKKAIQWWLTVSSFRGEEYLHLRKYFLSFDEGFLPSSEGAALKTSLDNVARLLLALLKIVGTKEATEMLLEIGVNDELINRVLNEES